MSDLVRAADWSCLDCDDCGPDCAPCEVAAAGPDRPAPVAQVPAGGCPRWPAPPAASAPGFGTEGE
ncbi:hypothetical protein [Blastochloris viridis]|uniref:Uncharacterized protein n=1 Tax=Blastochloris viridis TaxID=1079 RepID=A0A0H5BBX7_BLAVI|nr:hypothetical protein [Blastochloris viridis]ALK10304.1 hypothetical protein BVIR_2538 [Blastochloris viridis]BAR99762.1 hypothetical protein BV133_2169 [Blastochloris viridis]CUU42966.1 hypothetical protein BVIRIDIS_19820 [Blastochloris viridis]